MRRRPSLAVAATIALAVTITPIAGCKRARQSQPTSGGGIPAARVELTNAVADDGQWVMPAKDYASTRFSRLTEIRADNVSRLRQVWSFATGTTRGHEAAPLIVKDAMYVVTPFPNRVLAFDLTRPGANVKWTYDPQPLPAAQGVACCDVVNRGMAFHDGKVFFDTLDGNAIALDTATGKEVWRTKLGDVSKGETMTMAPLVVKEKVLFGNSGGAMGVRGWLAALDAKTGAVAWKAFSTGPDADCLIGASFKPFYETDEGKDLGVTTWPGDKWKIGGGTVWGWISYDPELDLLYHGTANPGPANPEQRPGDDKWTAGIFARRPDTGEAVWFYQWSPHDQHGYDGVNESVLVDLVVAGGVKRKVLLHADRNGYFYVLDRTTGEVVSAEPFVHVTTSLGVDKKNGKLLYDDTKRIELGHVVRDICPSSAGGKDWQPMAFSPKTGLVYIPHQNLCEDASATQANYIPGTPYLGVDVRMVAGEGGNRGFFTAWDPVAQKAVFRIAEDFPVWSGALVTEGDVAFYGTMDGWFKAVHAKTGELLWKEKLPSGIVGQPVTYRGPDGKQYVAILSGVGGRAGAIVAADLDARDQTAAGGFAHVMKDLPKRTQKGGMLHVFALP